MKFLLIGNHSNWMKIHLEQTAAGFINTGHDVRIADYNKLSLPAGFIKPGEQWGYELRQKNWRN